MIHVKHLQKAFNKKNSKMKEIKAINETSLSFDDSGLVCILGASGSGKTTLLNVISGLDDFDSGQIIIDDYQLDKYSSKKYEVLRASHFGFIFQNYLLLEENTVEENIKLALEPFQISEAEVIERCTSAMETLGILHLRSRLVSQLLFALYPHYQRIIYTQDKCPSKKTRLHFAQKTRPYLERNMNFRQVIPKGKCQFVCKYYNDLSTLPSDQKDIDINVIGKAYTDEELIEFTYNISDLSSVELTFINESSFPFIDVSQELFYQIYDTGSRQMSIYVKDYAYLDRVIKEINNSGEYLATSTYRMSAKAFLKDLNATRERLNSLSLFILLITTGAIVFVVCMIYMIRNKDYHILNQLGMKPSLFRLIIFAKLALLSLLAVLSIALTITILYNTGTTFAIDYLKYLMLPQYVSCGIFLLTAVSLGTCIYTSIIRRSFNRGGGD